MQSLSFPLRSTFLALPLEAEAREHFRVLQKKLSPFREMFSFQNPDSPHLTLQYWSAISQSEYQEIISTTSIVAAKVRPFSVIVNGAATFGSQDGDRVLFLTLEVCSELSSLQQLLPWKNPKPFHAHVTLARMHHPEHFMKRKKEIMQYFQDIRIEARIDRIRLYAIVHGKRQTPLQDFPFSAH